MSNLKCFDFSSKENKKLISKFNTLLKHQGEETFEKGFYNVCNLIFDSGVDYIRFGYDKKTNNYSPFIRNNCLIFKTSKINEVTSYLESQGYKWQPPFLKLNNGITVVELLKNNKRFRFIQ